MLHEPRILVLILDQPVVDNSLKWNYLVHVVNSNLKVLILGKGVDHNFYVILLLVDCHESLKFFGRLLWEVSFDYVRKTIWQLKFAGDDFSYENLSPDMNLVDGFKLVWLEAFLCEGKNVKLQI